MWEVRHSYLTPFHGGYVVPSLGITGGLVPSRLTTHRTNLSLLPARLSAFFLPLRLAKPNQWFSSLN